MGPRKTGVMYKLTLTTVELKDWELFQKNRQLFEFMRDSNMFGLKNAKVELSFDPHGVCRAGKVTQNYKLVTTV